jgi:hypothetical protein
MNSNNLTVADNKVSKLGSQAEGDIGDLGIYPDNRKE